MLTLYGRTLALNAILRKWGISQGQKGTTEGSVAASAVTPKSTNKRARGGKEKDGDAATPDAGHDDVEETPSKKAKVVKEKEGENANGEEG